MPFWQAISVRNFRTFTVSLILDIPVWLSQKTWKHQYRTSFEVFWVNVIDVSVSDLIVRLYTIITLKQNKYNNGTYRISVTSLFILNGHAGLTCHVK